MRIRRLSWKLFGIIWVLILHLAFLPMRELIKIKSCGGNIKLMSLKKDLNSFLHRDWWLPIESLSRLSTSAHLLIKNTLLTITLYMTLIHWRLLKLNLIFQLSRNWRNNLRGRHIWWMLQQLIVFTLNMNVSTQCQILPRWVLKNNFNSNVHSSKHLKLEAFEPIVERK